MSTSLNALLDPRALKCADYLFTQDPDLDHKLFASTDHLQDLLMRSTKIELYYGLIIDFVTQGSYHLGFKDALTSMFDVTLRHAQLARWLAEGLSRQSSVKSVRDFWAELDQARTTSPALQETIALVEIEIQQQTTLEPFAWALYENGYTDGNAIRDLEGGAPS